MQDLHDRPNLQVTKKEKDSFVEPMPSAMDDQWSSPKFITCPDCGERYDNGHKRRLIDTCGHPRCYSCLFDDKPCPLCQKIPQEPKSRASSFHARTSGSDESLHTSEQLNPGDLTKDQNSLSNPDLSEIHKTKALTLPARGYRTDNYFRSLYRYDPHAGENTDGKDIKNKPRKVLNYHKSLENLSDEFWRSVERAASPLSRETNTLNKSSTSEVTYESRLAVPSQTRPRTLTEGQRRNSLRAEALRKLEIAEGRPRAQSDLINPRRFQEGQNVERNDRYNTLPSNFHIMDLGERNRATSDRSSDISLPFSDSCSESSGDSDQLTVGNPHSPSHKGISKRWSYDEEQNERLRIAEERLYNGLMRSEGQGRRKKITKNPLENVVHWVVDTPKHEQQNFRDHVEETRAIKTIDNRRPDPPKRWDSNKRINVQEVHEFNGKPIRLSKSSSSTAL
ncbi:uncharacterized protein [Montipora capricornis]|uniref:uncharacterized protein isoform X2 n=1 Tax=Montipora capricornis TaxID=246305 RepID=UPI0035F20B73